jgi:prevent-host-death family protein
MPTRRVFSLNQYRRGFLSRRRSSPAQFAARIGEDPSQGRVVHHTLPNALFQFKMETHDRLSHMTKSQLTVNVHEAKTHLSRIIEQVLANGEPVTIARAGKPVVIVSAHPGSRPSQRRLGVLRGKVQLPEHLDVHDAEIQKMFEGDRQ